MQQSHSADSPDKSQSKSGSTSGNHQTAIKAYWAIYGGWRGLTLSPFLWIAVGLTIACYPYWLAIENGTRIWAQGAIDLIPSMLGFSLGGMAILLALSSTRLLRAIRSDGKSDSLFMRTVSSFFHFILLQTGAICTALLNMAHPYAIISAVGFFLMAYGTLVSIAIAWNLFDIARIFNATASLDEQDQRE